MLIVLRIINNMCSGQSEFMACCMAFEVLFLSLVGNFKIFSNHFPVTTCGLNFFSGAYLNKLLIPWGAVIENRSIKRCTRLGACLPENRNGVGF